MVHRDDGLAFIGKQPQECMAFISCVHYLCLHVQYMYGYCYMFNDSTCMVTAICSMTVHVWLLLYVQ